MHARRPSGVLAADLRIRYGDLILFEDVSKEIFVIAHSSWFVDLCDKPFSCPSSGVGACLNSMGW